MKKLATILAVSVFTVTASAQPPRPQPRTGTLAITGATSVDQYQLVTLAAEGVPIDSAVWDVLWASDITYLVSKTLGDEKGIKLIFTGPPGEYRVSVYATSADKMYTAQTIVTVKGTAPPVPPNPDNPVPPDPNNPPPTTEPGLRVLMVYESKDLTKYPVNQVYALNDTNLRGYMNGATVRVNNIPEWRVFDKDVNLVNEGQVWKDLMARPRTTLPWIVISNGISGYEGPLPATGQEVFELIKKYEKPPQQARFRRAS